jgi:hypothetical protein
MSATQIHFDDARGPIVVVHQPRSRIAGRAIFRICSAIFWCAAGTLYLRESLIDDSSAGLIRVFFALMPGVFFVLAALQLFILIIASKRPFAILRDGIEVAGHALPWERIVACRWNLYSPGTLMIAARSEKNLVHHSVPVPQSHQVLVEETLRRFGKWEAAQITSDSPVLNLHSH